MPRRGPKESPRALPPDPRRSRSRPRRVLRCMSRFAPRHEKSLGPVSADRDRWKAGGFGHPPNFRDLKRSGDRDRAVIMNDSRPAQQSATRPGESVTDPASNQVVNQNHLARRGGHGSDQFHGVFFDQVMQKKRRCEDVIIRGNWVVEGVEPEKGDVEPFVLRGSIRDVNGLFRRRGRATEAACRSLSGTPWRSAARGPRCSG